MRAEHTPVNGSIEYGGARPAAISGWTDSFMAQSHEPPSTSPPPSPCPPRSWSRPTSWFPEKRRPRRQDDPRSARHRKRRRRKLRIPEVMAGRPRAARPHYRRVAADRSAVFGLAMHFTPFFQFALLLVIPGALLILLTVLFWTGRT